MADIELRSDGVFATVKVDGHEVSKHTTDVTLRHRAGEAARLELDYIALDLNAELAQADAVARVYIGGVQGEGPTLRDAVADVLRQMDADR
jgi:hypothetical protein